MNNTYVVAYLSLFNTEIVQTVVYAKTEHIAATNALNLDPEEYPDMESVHDFCTNTDSYISVLKINNALAE